MNNPLNLSLTKTSSPEQIRKSLELLIAKASSQQFSEIWIDRDSFPTLCALLNGEKGWLMYMRYSGDAGFSSRNPGYNGPENAEIDYYLSNGQHDRYPASWAYPRTTVFSVLKAFAESQALGKTISWNNDSEDGTVSPDDPFVEPRTDFA